MKLSHLQPRRVFEIFEELSAIPRGSGNTKGASDYCAAFAERLGLSYTQDELNNIVIRKPGSAGYEDHPITVLQGHLDMVPQKDPDSPHDFMKDGLDLQIDGDFLSANGTTLGADDGIAVAMALAVLEDDTLARPPLEVLFTSDEETGMDGAVGIDPALITGRAFINLDSDEEGVLTVGCAGGARVDCETAVCRTAGDLSAFRVAVTGLTGGHSGGEIHTGRENASHLLAHFLHSLPFDFQLVRLFGGEKDNVITRQAEAVILTAGDLQEAADKFLAAYPYNKAEDPNLAITVTEVSDDLGGVSPADTRRIVEFLAALPYGVQAMCEDFENLPETSLNFGILRLDEAGFRLSLLVRSCISGEKVNLLHILEEICKKFDVEFSSHGHYPPWEYRKNSPTRDTAAAVYQRLYGKPMSVTATHGGLECGLFDEKLPGLDAISFGPIMFDIHTTRERLSIPSTKNTYEFLVALLAAL